MQYNRFFLSVPHTVSLTIRCFLLKENINSKIYFAFSRPAVPREPFSDSRLVNPLIPEHLFREHVVPVVVRVLHVRERRVRMVMLE